MDKKQELEKLLEQVKETPGLLSRLITELEENYNQEDIDYDNDELDYILEKTFPNYEEKSEDLINIIKNIMDKKENGKILKVDKTTCIGCGACIAICPNLFKMEGGKSSVLKQPENNEEKECAESAVNVCPVKCISLE